MTADLFADVDLVARLVALRQTSLSTPGGYGRRLKRAYGDDVAVWGAWLQTHPDDLATVLHLLVTEVAQHRIDHGLPALEAPTPAVPADPDVVLHGPAGEHATLDRLGAMLAAFPDWTISVTLDDGSTVTARPASAPHTPETDFSARIPG